MEQKTWSLYNLLVPRIEALDCPLVWNEQSTNSTKVYNPPINPADRIQHLLPTRYNMGIEYSTPLVALTSAWFYISGEIVQISIRQKPKRRKRLSSHYVQGIWTGSLPHCLQLFPSRLAAWSSTNCLQRYIKNPELPSNSGDFLW